MIYNKETDALFQELKKSNIKDFLANNPKEVNQLKLSNYLELLLEQKQLNKADVVANSCLDSTYAYHILAGRKNPSRHKIIALALAMGLSLDETQHALQYANEGILYPRNSWDAIIIFAIEHKQSVIETDVLLEAAGETLFLANKK